jgi:hypothetical protein
MNRKKWSTTVQLGDVSNDRVMQHSQVFVPDKIELRDNLLVWHIDSGQLVSPTHEMLARFVALHYRSDSQILGYARSLGVLGICRCGLPSSHNWAVSQSGGCKPSLAGDHIPSLRGEKYVCAEPLSVYRKLSKAASAIQEIGALLNQGKRAPEATWGSIWPDLYYGPRPPWTASVPWQKHHLVRAINHWVAMSPTVPFFESGFKGWEIKFRWTGTSHGPNLFGLLAFNLGLSVTRTNLAICSECGKPYGPSRRPNSNRRNYCPICRARGACSRNLKRASRSHARTSVA